MIITRRMPKCAMCRNRVLRLFAKVCSEICSIAYIELQKEKAHLAREKKARIALKVGRIASKTLRQWLKDAQIAFNSFIRARDALKPCISSGRPLTGKFDAGHYRSVGAARELRFSELNVHGQTVHDNQHLHGNLIAYRLGLIERIGQANVDWLEGAHPLVKYSIDDCKALIVLYKAKCKKLNIL